MAEVPPDARVDIYGGLLDSLRDGVFLVDDDGEIVYGNERFAEVTGLSPSTFEGTHYTALESFVRDESFAAFREHAETVLDGDVSERRVELPVATPGEGEIVVEARITPYRTEGLEGFSVVLRDRTESVEQAAALATKSEQLAVVNRVLRHDVRNDMNAVLGWGEQLYDHVTSAAGRDVLDTVLRHGRHVVEQTHSAGALVETIEDGWSVECEPVAVGPTLEREVEAVDEQYPEAAISADDPLDVPPVAANELLGSVFRNLLSNAIRHNDAATPSVSVSVAQTADAVAVSVADDGPGIPDTRKESVTEMGVKGPASSGTGLGLYLVRSLVESYGGSISIVDNEPRGTVVTVELPVATDCEDE